MTQNYLLGGSTKELSHNEIIHGYEDQHIANVFDEIELYG